MDVEQRARELYASEIRRSGFEREADIALGNGEWSHDAQVGFDISLRAIIAALTPQWQPIESAPKDGSEVLLWDGQGQAVCHWNETSRYWALIYTGWHAVDSQFDGATHWMSLPASPEVNNVHG